MAGRPILTARQASPWQARRWRWPSAASVSCWRLGLGQRGQRLLLFYACRVTKLLPPFGGRPLLSQQGHLLGPRAGTLSLTQPGGVALQQQRWPVHATPCEPWPLTVPRASRQRESPRPPCQEVARCAPAPVRIPETAHGWGRSGCAVMLRLYPSTRTGQSGVVWRPCVPHHCRVGRPGRPATPAEIRPLPLRRKSRQGFCCSVQWDGPQTGLYEHQAQGGGF